jgi:hypothetical protein
MDMLQTKLRSGSRVALSIVKQAQNEASFSRDEAN